MRFVQLGLSIALVATFFLGSEAFKGVLAYGVFVKWFGLYYYLQPLPKIGPVVFMIVSIFAEIVDILAAMVVAVIAYSNTIMFVSNNLSKKHGSNVTFESLP